MEALVIAIIAGGGVSTYLTQGVKKLFPRKPSKYLAGAVSLLVSALSILLMDLPIMWNSIPDVAAVVVGTVLVASSFYNNWVDRESSTNP